MKKKRVLISVVIILAAIVVMIHSFVPSYSSVLEANWGFELPVKALCKEVYEQDTGPSFHGDGVRYHVFSYRYEDYIDLMFTWRHMESSTLHYETYSEAADIWLAELELAQDQYPDYDACFYWYMNRHDNSEMIIFWDPEINRLYIVENLI